MSEAQRGPSEEDQLPPTEAAFTDPVASPSSSPEAPAPPHDPSAPPLGTSAPVPQSRRRGSAGLLVLAVLLIVVIAGVLLSPFWAPAVAPLLPWGHRSAPNWDALAARVAALEQRPVARPNEVREIRSAQSTIADRVAALEAGLETVHRNQEAVAQIKAAMGQLTQQVDATRKNSEAAAEAQAALARLMQRVDMVAQAAANAGAATAEIPKIQQEVGQYNKAADAIANRVDRLERQLRTQSSVDRSSSVLLLALLQMRNAVDGARPFPSEYRAFMSLAAGDPQLAAAAAPLADAARDGVRSRAVLQRRLADLADRVAAAATPTAKSKWWAQALDQLRGLVTIRRIDNGARTGPAATIETAQSDLAQGDLPGAVTAIEGLTGASAAPAQPWLQMARQRLAAETALARLQELLTARLAAVSATAPSPEPATGAAPAARPVPEAPSIPGSPPAASKTPS